MPLGTAFCSVAGMSACDPGSQLGWGGRTVSRWLTCVPLWWTETSFITCLSNTCTHVLQRCIWEQRSVRKWSGTKSITAVKAEGDGLYRVSGKVSLSGSHPGRERVLKGEKAGWRQDVCSPCKSGIFLCCFLGWLVKADTQVNTLGYYSQSLYGVSESWGGFISYTSCCSDNRCCKLLRFPALAIAQVIK